MAHRRKARWPLICTLFLTFTFLLTSVSWAETDVTNDVDFVKSRMQYDQKAKVSYLNLALRNLAENSILTGPVKMVVENITSSDVMVNNADGITDGKPYFEYTGDLFPGQISASKKLKFSNPRKKRFRYTVSVLSEIQVYDSDRDGSPDTEDRCLDDPEKTEPGACGCGVADTDTDNDATPNCNDNCPNDAGKTDPGICGCGVADTDSDRDSTPDCKDGCPNDSGKIAPGACGCGTSDADTDRDGVLNCKDGCPRDPNKTSPGACGCGKADADADGDGVLNCKDGCPSDSGKTAPGVCGCGTPDTATDSDSDGVVDCIDGCPSDPDKSSAGACGCGTPDTDTDSDGVANCNDGCPSDPNKSSEGICGCGDPDTDADSDGVADCKDSCLNTPEGASVDADGCVVANIRGHVRSAGLRVSSAQVKIGAQTASTDGNGDFSEQVSQGDLIDGAVFPIEVKADGYATGYAKVAYSEGKSDYQVEISLLAISDTITDEDDVKSGVDIKKGGDKVGELQIPEEAFPPGVTQITGNISYLDPTTTDIDAFPGNDFLAIRQGGGKVTLETLGLMEFDLKDQDGNPITTLSANATLCMKVPAGLNATDGETIPLWWYNPDDGLWHEDGQGTVEDRGADGLWMCGQVSHFTWWNYDRPVTSHSCFKFNFVKEADGSPANLSWYAEGVTYAGTSPERYCDCDADDPIPCPDARMSSFTVKKSGGTTEQIKVYTLIGGIRYYLKDDGDGTFSLTTDAGQARVFDTPALQGSCYFNEDVQNCQFLDGEDGILPLGGINYAPDIVNLTAPDHLKPGEAAGLTAHVTDAEGEGISLTWAASCGTLTEITPPGSGLVSSPADASATFTSPDTLGICEITLTAEDASGNTSQASEWIWIQYIPPVGTIQGIIYGADGQPVGPGVQVQLNEEYYGDEGEYRKTVSTGDDGSFVFDDVPCCNIIKGYDYYYCEGFRGQLRADLNIKGNVWTYENYGYKNCCDPDVCDSYDDGAGDDADCSFDIYVPTLWGTLQGTAYDSSGNPAQIASEIKVRWGSEYEYEGEGGGMHANMPVTATGTYGPLPVPADEIWLINDAAGLWEAVTLLYNGEAKTFDIGPGALGTLEGYLYDDNGDPVSNAQIKLNAMTESTDASGYYRFSSVPVGESLYLREYLNGAFVRSFYAALHQKDEVRRADLNGRNCRVEGTLYDWLGQPMPDIALEIDQRSDITDANGQFSAENLSTGNTYIWAEGEDIYVDKSFNIETSGSMLTIDVRAKPSYWGCPSSYYDY